MAAVSASVASSFLGVAGTVVGAGVMSVVATVGSAVYSRSLRRGQEQIVRTLRRPAMDPDEGTVSTRVMPAVTGDGLSPDDAAPAVDTTGQGGLSRRAWLTIAGVALTVFLVAMTVVTSFEAIAGRPLSSLFGNDSPSGTSVGRLVGDSSADDEPAVPGPSPTAEATPDASPEQTPGEETPTPEASPSPSLTPTPEPTPTATPTPQPTPTTVPSTSAPAVVPPGATPLG
ncbi:hypothetical protein [Motilibacter deserti]|uniref:Uncharacterized protein n=1 Tax=Motilibacter deserti TaxID=2714956 RepID=A0ABX0GNY0_9ACTN|nr:hypothetical protein [Motilibacter deserti]NHC12537.1 hypothetical protein [Motilibacter deserti]